jgi:hypothetical protein
MCALNETDREIGINAETKMEENPLLVMYRRD